MSGSCLPEWRYPTRTSTTPPTNKRVQPSCWRGTPSSQRSQPLCVSCAKTLHLSSRLQLHSRVVYRCNGTHPYRRGVSRATRHVEQAHGRRQELPPRLLLCTLQSLLLLQDSNAARDVVLCGMQLLNLDAQATAHTRAVPVHMAWNSVRSPKSTQPHRVLK